MQPRKVNYEDPQFRFSWLIEQMGGPSGVCNRLSAMGYEPPPMMNVRQWKARNKVPGAWAAALIQYALESGLVGSIEELRS